MFTRGAPRLNFSLWGKYTPTQRQKKLKEIRETAAKGEMPPWYYTYPMHRDAKLSASDRQLLAEWVAAQ